MPAVALEWYNARDLANAAMNPGGIRWATHSAFVVRPNHEYERRWGTSNVVWKLWWADVWSLPRNIL